MNKLDRFKGCLFGLAVGDAVGTTTEFKTREYCTMYPVTDMVGRGVHKLKAGEFTDDTSMALCLATSLVNHGFNAKDQIERYIRWRESGYLGSQNKCIGIGLTVCSSLDDYAEHKNPLGGLTNYYSGGNGSTMRLAPIPMYYFDSLIDTIFYAAESSKPTHGTLECLEACKLLANVIHKALHGKSKAELLDNVDLVLAAPKIIALANNSWIDKHRNDIDGSGYVVDSLEAALWCFYKTDNYKDAILMAANLGNDADTTAATVGQIAGAFYGYENIPESWRNQIDMKDLLEELSIKLFNNSEKSNG